MKNRFIFIIVFTIIGYSCNTSKNSTNKADASIAIKAPDDQAHILSAIVTFHNLNNQIEVKDHQLILKPGKVKENSLIIDEIAGSLKCDFLDDAQQIIHTQWIENPLFQRMETTDSDGKLISKDVTFEEQSSIIRVNFMNDMAYLSISENVYNREPRLLKTIPLTTHEN